LEVGCRPTVNDLSKLDILVVLGDSTTDGEVASDFHVLQAGFKVGDLEEIRWIDGNGALVDSPRS
jgi:hypothetical protein